MDKQVEYVRITKISNPKTWYADLIGAVLPYSGKCEKYYNITDGNFVNVADCEPYVFPTPIQEQDVEQLAKQYSYSEWTSQSERPVARMAYKDGFKAGYAANTGTLPDGMHLISTQDLKRLYDNVGGDTHHAAACRLRLLFPDVFTPRKQVIAVTDREGTEYYKCEVMGIMHTTKNKKEAYVIEHDAHGTELMNYLQEQYDECSYSFDNLE